jgi:hypothetical protein
LHRTVVEEWKSRRRGRRVYTIEWLDHDPAIVEMEWRSTGQFAYRGNRGWYLLHARTRQVARIGPDHGRFDSEDEALVCLINFYPSRVLEARRERWRR